MNRNRFETSVLLFALGALASGFIALPAAADGAGYPSPRAVQEETFRITWDVPLVPQFTKYSCWAAGIAMLVSWRDEISISPEKIAEPLSYKEEYEKDGLSAEDTALFKHWDLVSEPLQTFTVEGFKGLLESYGPLWVATQEPGPHIRVVTGIYGDGTAEGTYLLINDPWAEDDKGNVVLGKGSQYKETSLEFVKKESNLAEDELFNQKLAKPIYVVHCKKQLFP